MKRKPASMSLVVVAMVTCLAAGLGLPVKAQAMKEAPVILPVAVLQAESIVVARADEVPAPGTLAEPGKRAVAGIVVLERLKGAAGARVGNIVRDDPAKDEVENLPVMPEKLIVALDDGYPRQTGMLELGKRYVFFLRPRPGVGTGKAVRWEVIPDGQKVYDEALVAAIREVLPVTPPWSAPQDGIRTALVPGKARVNAGETLDLHVGVRNVSEAPMVFKGSHWPLETHTHWRLTMKRADGMKVEALPHPHVARKEIEEYFGKFPHRYEITLAPGEEHFFVLGEVTAAKPGWGYKENLDFKYYPLALPGSYAIAAEGLHFRADGKVIKAAGTVVVEQ